MSIILARPFHLFQRYYFLFVVILLRILLQSLLLLKAAKFLNTDESTVGTMAIDILEHNKHPFYIYWQVYNGAASLRAHLSAIVMFFTGVSPFAVKLICLLLDICIITITYKFTAKWFSERRAKLTVLLYIFTPPLVMHSITSLNGYLETIIFNLIMCYIFFTLKFTEPHKKNYLNYFLLGLVAGFAYYIFELSIIFIFTMILWTLILDKRFFLKKHFLIVISGFIIGNFPAIYFNLTRDFANWKYIWGTKFTISKMFLPDVWWIKIFGPLITSYFVIRTFGWRILAGFFEIEDEGRVLFFNKYHSLWTDFLQLFIYLFVVGYFLFTYRKEIFFYFKQLFKFKRVEVFEQENLKYIFLLSFVILQVCASIYNPQGYRFVYPVFPFLTILLSLLLERLWRKKQRQFVQLFLYF